MNNKTAQVLKGFLSLTDQEKQDFIDAVNDYLKQPDPEKRKLKERYNKRADLGPLSSTICACCGR